MKKLFSHFLFLIPLLLSAQADENFINWESGRRLNWDDFKATPLKNSGAAALTATHLGFSYNFKNGKISYTIECGFEKDKSWGLVKNDWILKHEQGHFDIAEIFARKLFMAISEYPFNKKTFESDLDKIYNTVIAEKETFQQQYDDETDNSINKSEQEQWLKKIAGLLSEYKSWMGYKL